MSEAAARLGTGNKARSPHHWRRAVSEIIRTVANQHTNRMVWFSLSISNGVGHHRTHRLHPGDVGLAAMERFIDGYEVHAVTGAAKVADHLQRR